MLSVTRPQEDETGECLCALLHHVVDRLIACSHRRHGEDKRRCEQAITYKSIVILSSWVDRRWNDWFDPFILVFFQLITTANFCWLIHFLIMLFRDSFDAPFSQEDSRLSSVNCRPEVHVLLVGVIDNVVWCAWNQPIVLLGAVLRSNA